MSGASTPLPSPSRSRERDGLHVVVADPHSAWHLELPQVGGPDFRSVRAYSSGARVRIVVRHSSVGNARRASSTLDRSLPRNAPMAHGVGLFHPWPTTTPLRALAMVLLYAAPLSSPTLLTFWSSKSHRPARPFSSAPRCAFRVATVARRCVEVWAEGSPEKLRYGARQALEAIRQT